MPKEAELASARPLAETTGDSEASDFASLFGEMDFASVNSDDPSAAPAADSLVLLEALVTRPFSNTDSLAHPDSKLSLPANLQPGGNLLPSLSPLVAMSGYSVFADQEGAAAIAFQGDGKNIVASGTHYVNSGVPAMQQTQAQLRDMMQASGMLNQNVDMFAVPKLDAGKQLEMLVSLTHQNTAMPVDNLISSGVQPSTHVLLGLQGVTEFSNVLAASSRSPEAMTASLNQPQWNQQVGDRINWMISQGLRQADIRLNPPELGMLEIRVQIQGDQASIQFNTAHTDVKDALDNAMPRLREMLAANGLNLADVNVSHQGHQQAGQGDGSRSGHPSRSEAEQNVENQATKSFLSNGIIDFYA